MEIKRGLVMVIYEEDLSDKEKSVIGVATNREESLKMIEEYFGIGKDEDVVMSDFKDIRDSNLDFNCIVTVPGFLGGIYRVWAEDFEINRI